MGHMAPMSHLALMGNVSLMVLMDHEGRTAWLCLVNIIGHQANNQAVIQRKKTGQERKIPLFIFSYESIFL